MMAMRLFLLLMLIFSTTAQAQNDGPSEGYACDRDAGRIHERARDYQGCNRERYRRGAGFRGSRMGGRRCGGHSRWDIPVQEARRLNPVEVSPQSLELGESLYRENCVRCHGDYGFGDGPQAKDLRVPPANLHHAARHYSDGELFYIIRKGRDPMPAWEGKLSEDALWNLINYLRFEVGARHGPRFNRDARCDRDSRSGYCADRYQTGDVVIDKDTEQSKEMREANKNHQTMDHDRLPGVNAESDHEEGHDEHQGE